jgi:hypothetical protein
MSIHIRWKNNGNFETRSIKIESFALRSVQLIMNGYALLNLYSIKVSFEEDVCFKPVVYNKIGYVVRNASVFFIDLQVQHK